MIKIQSLCAGTLCLALASNCCAQRCQPCMNMNENMNEKVKKLEQAIDKLFATDWFDNFPAETRTPFPAQEDKDKISLVQEKDYLFVKLDVGADIKTIDATTEGDLLTIDIPEKALKVYLKYDEEDKYLSIGLGHTVKEKIEKEGMYQESSSYSTSQHGQILEKPIKFQNPKIEYKDGVLSIIFPLPEKAVEKKVQKIKVDIKK